MGEVYKARDTRLDRLVTIKILPPHLATVGEARERFEREARTIANLNHPHICTLFDIGYENDTDYLVMEYLEGETLAQRLERGPLPLEQVLEYAIQVSDALDAAHRNGATHRDIKPGNIMLTKTAGSKVLDFGLAKLKEEVNPAIPPDERPTKMSLTEDGRILGTVQYMAPEQVEGKTKEIDGRTDIFSFGAVVFEMATGKKAFEGKSQASVMAAILKDDPPPMSTLQPMTPPALDHVVKKCLAKEREKRWQAASDLHDELKWLQQSSSQAGAIATVQEKPRAIWRRALPWAVALVLAIAASIAVWNLKPVPAVESKPIARLAIPLAANERLADLTNPVLAISPDGTPLAYAASREGGTPQLYLRALDSLEAKVLPTPSGVQPFFSSDGQWVGSGAKVSKVSINGGAPVILDSTPPSFQRGNWGDNDRIVYAPNFSGGLWEIPAAGGTPQPLTKLDATKRETSHRWPQVLLGSKAVLFTGGTGGSWDDAEIVAQRLDTGERKVLVQGGTYGRYVPTGHLVYMRGGTLMAVLFDLERLEVGGTAVPVVEHVVQSATTGGAQIAISDQGTLAYVAGNPVGNSTLVWVDRKGVEQPLGLPPRPYDRPRLSPDGRLLAVVIDSDIWVYDIARATLSRLTYDGGNTLPLWSPDGKRIAFASARGGQPSNLFWKMADGSGAEERLTTSEHQHNPHSFSPDGKQIAFTYADPATGADIWVLPMEGDPGTPGRAGKPRPFLQSRFVEGGAKFSPDGKWLAYGSNESGLDHQDIYVRPYPGPGGKVQISTNGGGGPLWAPNGELFYTNGDRMMVVETTTQPTFSAGTPKTLFQGKYFTGTSPIARYGVTADGQRFLMVKPGSQQGPTQINVVLNWFEELKQKVPSGR